MAHYVNAAILKALSRKWNGCFKTSTCFGDFQVITHKNFLFCCIHCSCTIFVLNSYYFDKQVMLVLLLIGVQYLHNAALSFEKGSSFSKSLLRLSPPGKKILLSKISTSPSTLSTPRHTHTRTVLQNGCFTSRQSFLSEVLIFLWWAISNQRYNQLNCTVFNNWYFPGKICHKLFYVSEGLYQ